MSSLLRSRFLFVSALVLAWLGCAVWLQIGFGGVAAHEDHTCPDGYPDTPVIEAHVDQADINSGEYRL